MRDSLINTGNPTFLAKFGRVLSYSSMNPLKLGLLKALWHCSQAFSRQTLGK
jgi:hypothetical protein